MENGRAAKDKLSLGTVARELELSKSTVSRAISGKGRIGEETKSRVMEYLEKKGCAPDIGERISIGKKTGNLAVVIPDDSSLVEITFFQTCLSGIYRMARLNEYDIFVAMTGSRDVQNVISLAENKKVDGVILTRTYAEDPFIQYLKGKGIPFVTIGSVDDREVIQVDHDHKEACRELTETLLAKGVERLAFIGNNEEYIVNRDRYKGYLEALSSRGKVPEKGLIYFNAENEIRTDRIVEDLMFRKADGILCMDEAICYWVLGKLKKEHVRVPGQMRVASCYHSHVLEDYFPAITTIKYDARELGMVGCKILLDRIQQRNVSYKTLLNYEINFKDSSL